MYSWHKPQSNLKTINNLQLNEAMVKIFSPMFDGSGGITTRSLDLDSYLKWVHTYLVQDDILDLQHKPTSPATKTSQ
jgi:hypothetical protein